MERDLSVGSILNETGRLISEAARETLVYVLAIGLLGAAGLWMGWTENVSSSFGFGFAVSLSNGLAGALFELAAAVASVVGGYLLLRRYLAARGRLHEGGERFWAYVGLVILSAIGTVIGFLLLIVPGFILLVRWSAASGFLIGARSGVRDSLKASWDATSGHGWAIFLAGLVVVIGMSVVGGVAGSTLIFASTDVAGTATSLVNALNSAVFLAFGIAIYSLAHDDRREFEEVFA
jgi:MFS family permease